ncbi:hypothetical protein [Methanobrevibacter arboriphilus]|uniref:Uncharacterized protein n=1 Tax=Methanobrevibacter arboriphilus TaxID=39441 RepID=A0ACA8R685_METAZ|nr:hypothetical protein [Methanobrevibacter arboriphilus]BBL62639.1 hypothetical protein MarbSA_16790 [Methanobrevibacter arboriphilus]
MLINKIKIIMMELIGKTVNMKEEMRKTSLTFSSNINYLLNNIYNYLILKEVL